VSVFFITDQSHGEECLPKWWTWFTKKKFSKTDAIGQINFCYFSLLIT